MVHYEPMALRSSSSSSSTGINTTMISSSRSITTRRTNKSSSPSSPSSLPLLDYSASSPTMALSTTNISIRLSSITDDTTFNQHQQHLQPMENDNTSSSNSSTLKRRRGRPLKNSISSLPSAPSSHKKQHIATTLQHGFDLQQTTNKLDKLKIKKLSTTKALSPPLPLPPVSLDTLRMGQQIDAWKQDQGDYYRARVVEISIPLIFVHYEGFPPDQADWIDGSDVRALENNKQTKAQRQRINKTDKSVNSIRRKESDMDTMKQLSGDDYDMDSLKTLDELEDDDRITGGGNYGPRGKESQLSWQDYATFYYTQNGTMARNHTGLVQDRRMAGHCCPCHSKEVIHPERPDRLSSILQQLHNDRILRYVKHLHGREATTQELAKAHTTAHIRNYTPHALEEEKTIKVTSIAALLNPIVSPPHSPTITDDRTMTTGPLRGIGGGVVVDTNKGHEIRHQKHMLAATTTRSEKSGIDSTTAVYPPDLVCQMTCGELGISVDTTFHPLYSSVSAKVATGSLISLVDAIVQGELNNGFALIRPPGHHAEESTAMGFCFFNNVAVAALTTLDKYPNMIKKILIIDWDVHHGNGTQKIFYDNPNVLYISIHRWDEGRFYPYSGAPEECGVGEGLGRNINIALSDQEHQSRPMGDPEFVAAFYHLIVPIARQFRPDMIFVSAGFDAAEGHPENLGGYKVTPRGYAIMTKMVIDLAEELCDGRLVLTLEGGYALQPLAVSAAASVTQLLPPWASTDYLHDYRRTLNSVKPNQACVDSLTRCVQIQQSYWHLIPPDRFQLPLDWRAKEGILTRPKREKRPIKIPIVEGY